MHETTTLVEKYRWTKPTKMTVHNCIITVTKVHGIIPEYVIEDGITTVYSGISSLQKVNKWYVFSTTESHLHYI